MRLTQSGSVALVLGTEPRIAIQSPHGRPARGGALEWVTASASPTGAFETLTVEVDGQPVPTGVRPVGVDIFVSAWCDTRGLPPGVHTITVTGTLADGDTVTATLLLTVTLGQPVEWWTDPTDESTGIGLSSLGDPGFEEALARTALGGPPLVILAQDGTPGPGALEQIAAAFTGPSAPDVVIGDDAALIGEDRWLRWRKRAFQSDALPAIDQVGPLLAVGPRAADVLCDALPATAGIYGLALELVDRGFQTLAVPHVLALTTEARLPVDGAAARAAVERLADRRGRRVVIEPGPVTGLRDVRWPLADEPAVVAIVPSRTPELAAHCLAALAERTDHGNLRVVLVDSADDPEGMVRVADDAAVPTTLVRYPTGEPFNYQRAVNLGTDGVTEELVLLLNDDVTPLNADWLTRMAELATLPGVGAVGALLRHPDGRIQHGGVQIGEGTGHLYHDAPADAPGHRFELLVPGNPEAVTGACLLLRREALVAVGGLDEDYVHVYGDVDLCFRLQEHGWRIAWCPGAELEHLESASYGKAVHVGDIARFGERWKRDRGGAHRVRTS